MKPRLPWKRASLLMLCVPIALILSGCLTSAPQITPAAGAYTCPQTVTVTDSNAFATIYYTTDGSAPTTSSTKYTAAFTLNSTSTVRAIALAPGASLSKVVSVAYTCATANLTRADFAVLLQQRFNLPQPSHPLAFPDVHPTDAVYSAVEAAAPFMNPQILCPGCQLNMNFFPNEPITRAISTITLVRILAANGKVQFLSPADSENVLSNVPDAKSLPRGARPYFATAIKNSILTLNAGNTIQANLPHTREYMVMQLENIKKRFNLSAKPVPVH